MRGMAFSALIVPDKIQMWRELWQEIEGPRRQEYEQSRRQLGIVRETIHLQHTPQGDVAVLYLEAEDPHRTLRRMGASDSPFDRWFREWFLEAHELDLTHWLPDVEGVFHWQTR